MLTSIFPVVHLLAGFFGLSIFGVGSFYFGKEQELHATVAILLSVWWLDLPFLEQKRLRYLILPTLSVFLYWIMGINLSDWVIGQAIGLSALIGAMLEWKTLRDNQKLFTRNLYRLILIFISFVSGALTYGLSTSFTFAIEKLFNVSLPHGVLAVSQLLGAVVFVEAFAYLQSQNRFGFLKEETLEKAHAKVCSLILFPFFVLYSGLLALYEMKLLLMWEAPRGYATFPASIALLIWFLLLTDLNQKPNVFRERGMRFFGLIPLVLLVYGIGFRVIEYGLTPERIYAVFCAFISVVSVSLFLAKGKLDLRMPAFIGIALLSLTLIPGLQVVNFNGSYTTSPMAKAAQIVEPAPKICTSMDVGMEPMESGGLQRVREFRSEGDFIELKDPGLEFQIDRKKGAFTLKVGDESKLIVLSDEKSRTQTGPWNYDVLFKTRRVRVVINQARLCADDLSSFSGLIFY